MTLTRYENVKKKKNLSLTLQNSICISKKNIVSFDFFIIWKTMKKL
jgi:hypothetical protein